MRGTMTKNLSGSLSYLSFCPDALPPNPSLVLDANLAELLIRANKHLAVLNTLASDIPDADLFISTYVRKEALMSSQIEGTQCTLDDIFDPYASTSTDADVADVVNYVHAIHEAMRLREQLPICNRLIKEVHAVLMQGVRGEEKAPGEFRVTQNWVGPSGCTLKDARYVPPNVGDMQLLMGNLEKYMNDANNYDPLVNAALIHYQFETIHPFLDGNGRVGRLLVLLYLLEKGALAQPVLYVSYYLKKNQTEYYDRLTEARRSGNFEQWVRFFLEAVDVAAVDACKTTEQIKVLYNQNAVLVRSQKRRANKLVGLLDYLGGHPIVSISAVSEGLGVSFNTASSYIEAFVELGILKETTRARRNRTFAYEAYLQLLRDGTE